MALYEETKQIQKELDDKFYSDDPLKYVFSKIEQNSLSQSLVPTEDSAIYGPKDGRNYSRFFGEIYDPTYNRLEDVAAGRQSTAERLAYMLPRIGVKVASEVAQLPGYLGGAIAWGTTGFDKEQVGLLVDNFWQRAIQSAEESVKGKLPVYVSDKVKNGNLLDNIFSSSFWATEGADGIGFLLSFLVPGQALKAAKFGAKTARLLKPGANIASTVTKGADMANAIDAATIQMARNIDFVGATVINTLFESAAEGGETFRNVLDKTGDNNKAATAAVDVVKKNFGILLLSNAVDQYWLFKDVNLLKRTSDPMQKAAKNNILDKVIDPKTGLPITEAVKRTGWEKAGVMTKTLLEGIGKEGFYEEGMQFAASKYAEEKADNPELEDRGFMNQLIDLVDTYVDNLSDTDMQKSIFLGSVLGGGMSMIHQAREDKATRDLLEGTKEKKVSPLAKFIGIQDKKETPGLRQLIANNWATRSAAVSDLAETTTDKDGNVVPKLNDDGTYKIDEAKVKNLVLDQLIDFAEKEKLISFARTGNTEGFKYIKEKLDFRYMLPFLQQEGGLNILLKHIDALADKDKENFEKEGILYEIDDIKKDLKNKAVKFQAIYDRINNTHDLLMDDVNYTKEDKQYINDFSKIVHGNKLNSELQISFHNDRIDDLRNQLSEINISSAEESNLSSNLLKSLKESYDNIKKEMTTASIKQTDRVLFDLEKHQESLIKARQTSANLYDKKWLNKSFKEYTDSKINQANTSDGTKSKEILNLDPKLRPLFDKAVIYEKISDPEIGLVRHSGELEISFKDKSGNVRKAYATVISTTDTGNMSINVHKMQITDKDTGRVTLQNIEDARNSFINKDDTFTTFDKESFELVNIDLIKTPEEVQKERRSIVFLDTIKKVMVDKNTTINKITEQISNQRDYISYLKDKLTSLQEKELASLTKLTKAGTNRKISVKLRVEASKNISKQFITANQLKDEIKSEQQSLKDLLSLRNRLNEDKQKLKDLVVKAKSEGDFLSELNEITNEYDLLIKSHENFIDVFSEVIANDELYLKRLNSTLQGYVTSFANILNLRKNFHEIAMRRDLTEDQVQEEILALIANKLSQKDLTDEQYEQLGLIPTHLNIVLERIKTVTATIDQNKKLIENSNEALVELTKESNLYQIINRKFNKKYFKYLDKLNVLEQIVDSSETPEDDPRFIDDEISSILKRDAEYKHVFYDENSWFVSRGNQEVLVRGTKDDDLSRWYIFVNKLAYQKTEGGASKYVLKSYTVNQVKELDQNNIIRKRLKFYAGEKYGSVTYDKLTTLPKEAQDIASNDIKMVVYERNGKPLEVSRQVFGESKDPSYIIYNSFAENKIDFSLNKLIKLKLKEKYPKDKTYSEDKIKVTTEEVQAQFAKSWDKYLENREKLKTKSYIFDIAQINPGVKVIDDTTTNIEVLEAAGTNDIKEIAGNFVIHVAGTRTEDKKSKKPKNERKYYRNPITRQLSWTNHELLSGYLYLQHDNRFERIKPRTFDDTKSIEDIINIIRYLATNPKEADDIEQYLHKIMYINAKSKEHKIGFTKYYGANRVKVGFRSLFFGNNELTSEQLVNGEGLDLLRDFLKTKYWNFDKKSLEEKTFTEYKVIWTGKKPKITSKFWDIKDGGYVGFLFSNKDNNIPKGVIFAKKQSTDFIENTKNPQYINQSVSLSGMYEEFKQAAPAKSNVEQSGKKGLGDLGKKSTPSKGLAQLGQKKSTTEDTKITEDTKKESKPKGLLEFGNKSSVTISAGATVNRFATKEEYWNSLPKDEQTRIITRMKGKSEDEIKELYFKVYNASLNDNNELNRATSDLENQLQEELNTRLEWFKNKFPQIPIHVIENTLLQNSWGRLTKDGFVLISDTAAEGTIYHEAYHTYSLLFLSEKERTELYNEVNKRLGKTLIDKEAEEFLAEEFRMFMQSPNNYKFNKGEQKKQNWFNQLLDYILHILGDLGLINKDNFAIENTFKKINNTDTFIIEDKVLKERINNLRNNYDRNRVIADMSEKETLYAIQDFNYSFFKTIFDPLNTDTDLLFDLNNKLSDIYNDLYAYYSIRSKTNSIAQKILDNFDAVKIRHVDFLKNYQITISDKMLKNEEVILEDAGLNEDLKEKNATEYMDSLSVDLNKLLDNPIRMVIAGLPSVTLENGKLQRTLSEFSTYSTAVYSDLINILSDQMAGVTSFTDMYQKLFILSETYPEFLILLKRLGIKGLENNSPTVYQVNLQNQFYKNFARTRTNPKLVNYTHDGKKYEYDATEFNIRSLIQSSWINNAMVLANDKDSYIYKTSYGDHLIKLKTLKEDLTTYLTTKFPEKQNELGIIILEQLGLNLNNRINNQLIKNYLFWLNDSIKDRKDKLALSDIFNNDVIKNNKEYKELIDFISANYLNNKDLSYFNQDKNREFSITLNSHLSNVTNLLNTIRYDNITKQYIIPDEIKHLFPYDPETEEGSLFNTNSIWLEKILSGDILELVLLKGITTPNKGVELSKATLGDYKSVTANALLRGIVPFLRSADRKLEYGFKIGTINYNITDEIFRSTMYKYLEDELRTSFALYIDPDNWGGNLVKYSKNAKYLRVFNFLENDPGIKSLEDFYNDHKDLDYEIFTDKNNKDTVKLANKLTKSFIKIFEKKIDKAFNTYIKDIEDTTLISLKEDNLVKEEGTGRNQRFFLAGFDEEILTKIGIQFKASKTVSDVSMNKILRIMAYNSFVGNNEQLKLFLSDLAHFRNAADFHKRTTGATSTKYNQRDDIEIRQHLDDFYRRFDNKSRTDSTSMVVVDDEIGIVNNKELANYFKDYSTSNGTDAQSWVMLDEYRDIMLRHGIWYPRHERTYQYEMQKFANRLIELSKTRKLPIDINRIKAEFISETGMFYKHTKGKIGANPMYLGIELKESQLTPLTIIKPQGFGRISNVNGLSPVQFWKTSAAPIFFSAIEDDSPVFDFLLSMIKNQQSIFTFSNYTSGSAHKTEVIGNSDGKIQKLYESEDYISQDLRYRDFGIQLDIHEETEGEVSVSTQRTRLEFLDIFNLGEPVKNEKLANNRHNYTSTVNDIQRQLREELLGELGIVYDEQTDRYSLPDKNTKEFTKKLIDAFQNRQMPLNVIDGLELALTNDDIEMRVFDVTLSKFKIEEVLTAMVRNKMIKRKVYGDMLIQESDFLYGNKLKFYSKNKKTVTPMEVMIALPKDLIALSDDLGGLDKLNMLIDDYYSTDVNRKTAALNKLGEDFFKLLTVPANRIPGQSIASLDIVMIRKFLPHYHGNKIVIPAEATVKTGSDFDVDKLTTYFNNFKYKDGKVIYNDDINTVKGKQNLLNELTTDSLLDVERFIEFITPLDTKYLKDKAYAIRAEKKQTEFNYIENRTSTNNISDILQWWYNMQKGYEFWVSKSGVAAVAVQNAAHALEQTHPIELTDVMPLMFEGQQLEPGDIYKSGFIKDSSGRNISQNFAEFLSAFVDAAKDPFIFEITNTDTFNAIAALNRFGNKSSVGIDLITEFYSQDVIKNFLKLKKANSSQFMTYNQYNIPSVQWSKTRRLNQDKQYQSLLLKLQAELKPSKEALIPTSYNNSVSKAVQDYIQIHTDVFKRITAEVSERNDIDDLQKHRIIINLTNADDSVIKAKKLINDRITDYGYKYLTLNDLKNIKSSKNLTNDQLYKLQIQVLDNFMMYSQLGWAITNVNSFLRPDASSSFNRHLNAISASVIVGENSIKERGLVNFESVLYSIAGYKDNPSLIREAFESKQNTPNYFQWTSLIQKTPIVKEFFESQIYPIFANPNKRLRSDKIDAALQTIESDFITFLSVYMLDLPTDKIQEFYENLFTNNNSVAYELLKMQSQIDNNLGLNELIPMINKIDSKSKVISETNNITLLSKKQDVNKWDAMEADIFDLGISGTTTTKEFVTRLVLLSHFQSGYSKSPISIHEIIPNRFLIPMVSAALSKFNSMSKEDQLSKLNSFVEQMVRNNYNNSDIVTRYKFSVKDKQPIIRDDKKYHKNNDYISALMFLDEAKVNGKSPFTIGLYKRISATEFQLISRMGYDFKFKEYYPDAITEDLEKISIIESNKTYNYDVKSTTSFIKDIEDDYINEPEEYEDENDNPGNIYYGKPSKNKKKGNIKYYGNEENDLNNTTILDVPNDYAVMFNNEQDLASQRVLRAIEYNSESEYNIELAKILRQNLRRKLPIYIYDTAYRDYNTVTDGNKYNGFYAYYSLNSEKNFIGVYEQLDNNGFERTVLHENLHALTMDKYDIDIKFRNKIDNLARYVGQVINNTSILGEIESTLDIDDLNYLIFNNSSDFGREFIAYGLSNPEFQKVLSMIPALDINNVNPDISKSLFRQFLETIFELFESFFVANPKSREALPYSAFAELVSVVDESVKTPLKSIEDFLTDFASMQDIAAYRANYSLASQKQQEIKSSNKFELAKDDNNDFDSIYPQYSHFTDIEKEAFIDAVNKGEIKIACSL